MQDLPPTNQRPSPLLAQPSWCPGGGGLLQLPMKVLEALPLFTLLPILALHVFPNTNFNLVLHVFPNTHSNPFKSRFGPNLLLFIFTVYGDQQVNLALGTFVVGHAIWQHTMFDCIPIQVPFRGMKLAVCRVRRSYLVQVVGIYVV